MPSPWLCSCCNYQVKSEKQLYHIPGSKGEHSFCEWKDRYSQKSNKSDINVTTLNLALKKMQNEKIDWKGCCRMKMTDESVNLKIDY